VFDTMPGVKQGDAISLALFNAGLQQSIRNWKQHFIITPFLNLWHRKAYKHPLCRWFALICAVVEKTGEHVGLAC
jgi:hypothetical protein